MKGRLGAPDFSNDDPIGALPQRLSDEIAQRDCPAAIEPLVPRLHLRHVRQISIDLEDLFTGHHSPIRRDLA